MSEKLNMSDMRADWPTSEADVTVEKMARSAAHATQLQFLRKMAEIGSVDGVGGFGSELCIARTDAVISGVALLICLEALRRVSPEDALKFAQDCWVLCESGDSFGEVLWELGEMAGLDMESIKLPESVPHD